MEPLTTSKSRMIIKTDWAESNYYDEAESSTNFWTDNLPFLAMFKQLDITNCIELACGHGRHTAQVIAPEFSFTLVDINDSNIEFCRARFSGHDNVRYLKNDGSSLQPIMDASATSLFCYDAMVHFELEDVMAYILETFRVLMPGGKALLHFSNYDKAPGQLYHENPHWRNFNSAAIFRHFAIRSGFEILALKTLPWGSDVDLDGVALLRKPV